MRKGKSCYARHRKREYLYSPSYLAWKDAAKAGHKGEQAQQAMAHNRQFGLSPIFGLS